MMDERIKTIVAESLPAPRIFDAHIYITTPYEWGKGWGDTPEEKRKQVLASVLPMFLLDGWHVTKPSPSSWSAPEALKGKERVYMHPMDFSGEMTRETFEYLCESLRTVERDSCGLVRYNYGKMFGALYSDEDMDGFYAAHEDAFRDIIVDCIRREKAVPKYFLFDDVFRYVKVPTIKEHIGLCSGDPQYELLEAIFQHMLDDGTVVETEKGYRLRKWLRRKHS